MRDEINFVSNITSIELDKTIISNGSENIIFMVNNFAIFLYHHFIRLITVERAKKDIV